MYLNILIQVLKDIIIHQLFCHTLHSAVLQLYDDHKNYAC